MSGTTKPSNGVGSPPLERYAWPWDSTVDGPDVLFVELDRSWNVNSLPANGHLVVGRPPLRSVKPLPAAFASALRRSTLRYRLRKSGLDLIDTQELAPPPGASGVSGSVRKWLLSGALYRLSSSGRWETLFDAIGRAAGADTRAAAFHAPGDGSIVARMQDSEGRKVVIRAAPAGSASDPSRIADALEDLGNNGVTHVPRLLDRGEVEGVSWITESFLSGSEPANVDDSLMSQIVSFCSQLPSREEPPTAVSEELHVVSRALPDRAATVSELENRVAPVVARLPATARHGDLWSGNLLLEAGRLVGVVDWAAWHPSAVPGTDLLHLWAAERKRGGRGELGEAWRERPWKDARWLQTTAPYWAELGVEPDGEILETVAIAWWATWVAQSLTRHPARGRNERWIRGNVDVVLETFS